MGIPFSTNVHECFNPARKSKIASEKIKSLTDFKRSYSIAR
jgi:hypothetical protein